MNDKILRRIAGPWNPITAVSLNKGSNRDIWTSLIYDTMLMQSGRDSYANCLSQNSIVDDGVGRALAALRQQGLPDNTLMVYPADQGNHFGQHGTWGHTNGCFPARLHDTTLHIPLLARSPARHAAGNSNNAMVGQYDIMPTLLAALKVSSEPHQLAPGQISRGDNSENWPDAVFFEQRESRGIRTADTCIGDVILAWEKMPCLTVN